MEFLVLGRLRLLGGGNEGFMGVECFVKVGFGVDVLFLEFLFGVVWFGLIGWVGWEGWEGWVLLIFLFFCR